MGSHPERLATVLAAEGISCAEDPVRLDSNSTEAWRVGSVVIRICSDYNRERLHRESTLAASLPSELKYPQLLSSGSNGDMTWIVTRYVDGVGLDRVWPTLTSSQQRHTVSEIAGIVMALHEWSPPLEVTTMLTAQDSYGQTDVTDIMGAAVNPLPIDRVRRLAEHARRLPHVSPELIDRLQSRLQDLAEIDPFPVDNAAVVVHGDLHFANLLWRDDRIVALLDLEWARLGPRDLELEPFLRSVDYGGQEGDAFTPAQMHQILSWLGQEYPQLFAHPDIVDRVWLYVLAYTVRDIHAWPIPKTGYPLAADHPVTYLAQFLKGPDIIRQILPH